MRTLLARRLLVLIPTVWGIITVVFFAVRLGGVSPALAMFPKADGETIARIEKENGWDRPLTAQYAAYFARLAKGDLGRTYVVSRLPVAEEIAARFPRTIELALAALLLAVPIGLLAGIVAAARPNSVTDYGPMTAAMAGVSFPVFWLAMLAIMLFGQWLPFEGRLDAQLAERHEFSPRTHFMLIDTLGNPALFLDALKHLLLPALVLSTIPMAVIARMTRASLLEVLGEDYIRTARAKGLASAAVLWRHALKNAMPAIATVIGLQCGYLLAGAVLTESIFSWQGLGTFVFECARSRDYNGLQGSVILLALVFVIVNFIVDVSYAWLDPRIRVS